MPEVADIDRAIGLTTFLTSTPGTGGRLRAEVEDFQVIEQGAGPAPGNGPFTAARIRLTNWETNRFAQRAAQDLRIRPGQVAFAGMKDKRAVTEQWFTFKCPPDRLAQLATLQDVEVLGEPYPTQQRAFTGAHEGNRFVLRVRQHQGEAAVSLAQDALDQVAAHGGVPNWFGPQRFGGTIRPVTAEMGRLIVAGELEQAVQTYCGRPVDGEPEDAFAAREHFETTGDAQAALAMMPPQMGLERDILGRVAERPDDARYALLALPFNLLQLFVHAWQSLAFNQIVSERLDAGLGIAEAHVGDLVQPVGDETTNVAVTAANQRRVQDEIDRGRAAVTGPLPGLISPTAAGEPGDIEARVLGRLGIEPGDFRCYELPRLASEGRRRALRMAVADPAVEAVDGDPVVSFTLGRGAYATIVMREVMKSPLDAY